MSKRRHSSLFVVLFALSGCGPFAVPKPSANFPVGARASIDEAVIAQMVEQTIPGLALGVVENGEISYLQGYGWADLEGDVRVDPRAPLFRWASVSKTLTGTLAVQAARAGKLDLDASVSRYVPGYDVPSRFQKANGDSGPIPPAHREVSVRMLLGNTSGTPHYDNGAIDPEPSSFLINNPDYNTGIEWALALWLRAPLVSIPGEEYNYSTFGFNLAGVAIENAASERFADGVRARIAEPLGLVSLQPDYGWRRIANRVVGYQLARSHSKGEVYREGHDDVSWKLPGGGWISTLKDLTEYCRGLTGTALLDDEQKSWLWTSGQLSSGPNVGKSTGYGLGFTVGTRGGLKRVAHSGSQQKAATYLALYPERKTCVLVMANQPEANVSAISAVVEAEVTQRPY